MRKENINKNRFENLLAYDHSRVVLKDTDESDYINANYIHGFIRQKAFIAAQSPFNRDTVYDFLYMIYTENITQVVFLARLHEDGVMKCEKYWPDTGTFQTDDIIVRFVESELYASFVVRYFDIMIEGQEIKRVTQYQFTKWPEHGVPDDPIPFLDFRRKIRTDIESTSTNPILVHCGTGISRTAVFIGVDSLLDQAKLEHSVNVFQYCQIMRNSRTNMVRTYKHYKFIYDTVFEALITNYNSVGSNLKVNYRQLSKVNPITDKSYFHEQFDVLEKYVPEVPVTEFKVAQADANSSKNHYAAIVPPEKYRVTLRGSDGGPIRSDYINAVFVDSYLCTDAYIITQTPLENTVSDFWKMIYDYKVRYITIYIFTLT